MVLGTPCLTPPAPCFLEQFYDLGIRGLLEVLVPEADCPEVRERREADELIDLGLEKLGRLGGAYGSGQDQASRPPQAQGLNGRTGGHARREAVVDQDRGSPADLRLGPATPEVA